jgi:uncharacterized protein
MSMNIDELAKEAEPLYYGADPAHDFSHIMRVLKWAKAIGENEGARMDVLLPAALLHDVGCSSKDLGNSKETNDKSLDIAEGFLREHGFGEDVIGKILYLIDVHGFSKGIEPETIEAKVLQDADRLDALGAVGIARTFLVGGAIGRPMHHPRDPFCLTREPDDKQWNLDHFYRKLLKLEEGMHTKTGKEMAGERTQVMKDYLEQMRKEII